MVFFLTKPLSSGGGQCLSYEHVVIMDGNSTLLLNDSFCFTLGVWYSLSIGDIAAYLLFVETIVNCERKCCMKSLQVPIYYYL